MVGRLPPAACALSADITDSFVCTSCAKRQQTNHYWNMRRKRSRKSAVQAAGHVVRLFWIECKDEVFVSRSVSHVLCV